MSLFEIEPSLIQVNFSVKFLKNKILYNLIINFVKLKWKYEEDRTRSKIYSNERSNGIF